MTGREDPGRKSLAVDVSELHYHYPAGRRALCGATFGVQEGGRVALLGPNGAGKSTLLFHLNGLLMPSDGRVRIMGNLVTARNRSWVRRRVGLVFQDPNDQLFMPSVEEDLRFGPVMMGLGEAETTARVSEALEVVGLADVRGRLCHELSFGEKKRVALAGVLAMGPRVLVLDEPTSNLDPRARRELLKLLEGLPCSIVVATHDLEFANALCDQAVILDRGRTVASGPVGPIFDDTDLLLEHGLR